MTSDWPWDDRDAVPDDELLLRRVRRVPNCVVPNLTTQTAELKSGALIFDPGDGMSVHQDSIRERLGVGRERLCDWDRYHAISFQAAVVRAAQSLDAEPEQVGGIVHDDDEDDQELGEAHALVRTRSKNLPKGQKQAIREHIMDNFTWVDEDPNCPAR